MRETRKSEQHLTKRSAKDEYKFVMDSQKNGIKPMTCYEMLSLNAKYKNRIRAMIKNMK
jgi:hypothetical protein